MVYQRNMLVALYVHVISNLDVVSDLFSFYRTDWKYEVKACLHDGHYYIYISKHIKYIKSCIYTFYCTFRIETICLQHDGLWYSLLETDF